MAVYISDDTVVLENCDGLGSSVSTFRSSQDSKHHACHGRTGQNHFSLIEPWHEQDMVLLFVAPVSEKLRQKDHHGFEASMAYRERPCLNNSKVDTGLQNIVNGTF